MFNISSDSQLLFVISIVVFVIAMVLIYALRYYASKYQALSAEKTRRTEDDITNLKAGQVEIKELILRHNLKEEKLENDMNVCFKKIKEVEQNQLLCKNFQSK